MKTEPKLAMALIAAALLCGCSSGGGVKVTTGPDLRPAPVDHGCGTVPGYDIQCVPYLPVEGPREPARPATHLVAFSSWESLQRGNDTYSMASGLAKAMLYETTADSTIQPGDLAFESSDQTALFQYDKNGDLIYLVAGGYGIPARSGYNSRTESLAAIGQPGIDIVRSDSPYISIGATPFASINETHVVLLANPYDLGWNYQSFGVWDGIGSSSGIVATTFGAATPGSAVPTSGAATFTGKLAGLYISPAGHGSIATADLSVSANFSNRSLSFASSSTSLTRDLATATAAPNLNLSGTLTYSPGSNTFTGTLVNAGGTMNGSTKGQFYGSAAQELGGVFTVKSPTTVETMVGAYGAKR